jgi:hypothetical protein
MEAAFMTAEREGRNMAVLLAAADRRYGVFRLLLRPLQERNILRNFPGEARAVFCVNYSYY